MKKLSFPGRFLWGSATSDYQIEGAVSEGGKGETIWDRFSNIPGKIANSNNGNIACDHYHRYEEDIGLMKEIGLQAYRFSISWARIFPDGKGIPNREGIDFYKRLVNSLLKNGIKPVATLYHWNLPQKLQDTGGWANRDTACHFQQYAYYVFNELGDIINIWTTHNEPFVTSFLGHFTGEHAPGIKDFLTSVKVSHNVLLSHGMAVQAYRQMGQKGEIGITLDVHPTYPVSTNTEDIEAAIRMNKYFEKWYSDPIFKGKFPDDLEEFICIRGVRVPRLSSEDLKLISQPIDYLGINYYFPTYVWHNASCWPLEADWRISDRGDKRTSMGWGIYPEGLYHAIAGITRDYGKVKIYVTENGAVFNDIVDSDGKVNDPQRIDFLSKHVKQLYRCIEEGMNVQGYFIWSLMDNFEWAYGYDQRFGIIHVDFKTLKRVIKSSGYWYGNLIRNNGL